MLLRLERDATVPDEQMIQVGRTLRKVRIDPEHHVVLIQLREHGRDLPLAVRVVERLIDGRGGNAESSRGVPIERDLGTQTLDLLIARNVAKPWELPQLGQHLRRERVQLIDVRIFERQVLKTACGSPDPQPTGS